MPQDYVKRFELQQQGGLCKKPWEQSVSYSLAAHAHDTGYLQVAAPPTPGVSAPLAPASPLVAVSETTAVPGKCSESQYRSLHDACTQPAALVSSACQIEITAAHSAQASSTLTAQQLNSCGSPECSELQHNSVSLQLVDQSSISQPCGGTLSSEQSGSALQAHSCVTSTSEQSAYQHQTADAFLHRNPATSAQGNHVHSGEIPTDPASSAFPSPVSALVDTGLCGLHQPRPGHGTDELASISYYKTRVSHLLLCPGQHAASRSSSS